MGAPTVTFAVSRHLRYNAKIIVRMVLQSSPLMTPLLHFQRALSLLCLSISLTISQGLHPSERYLVLHCSQTPANPTHMVPSQTCKGQQTRVPPWSLPATTSNLNLLILRDRTNP